MRECPRCEVCYEDDVELCPQDQSNTKATLPGPRLLASRYLLEKRLGRGAMGQVYLARDQNLMTRQVAVKTVRPDILSDEDLQDGEAIARFEREARAAASIRHQNVVGVTDFGQTSDGVFFLVMEYVEGETLYQLLRREGTVSPQRAASIMRQVVAGVEAAHDEGILHRDLKPANIFLMQQKRKVTGDDGFVKVGDFGLAKIVNADRSDLTSGSGPASRGIIGTPEYMAPEQMQADAQLDARADIYALGTIAYHMLGGRPPFTGNITQLIAQKLTQAPPALSSLRSDVNDQLDTAIMKALAKEPADRPATASEWLESFVSAASLDSGALKRGDSRLVIMAPSGAEVYVDDERYGSVGRSGRVILTSLAPGQHVLRVSKSGEPDDERVIEIRSDIAEQIIEAQLKIGASSNQLTPSRGGSLDSKHGVNSTTLVVVMCTRCHSRFAEGVKFCGRCGNTTFEPVSGELHATTAQSVGASQSGNTCSRCGTVYYTNTKFCGRCGIPLGNPALEWRAPRPVEVFCRTCKTSYPAGTKFCGRCGTRITP
ncbi:MAG TPA: protein kinase [Pyrinomonadaceae bacterium]|nr:protein kinase [Pyrinomonadaceae bacterium]